LRPHPPFSFGILPFPKRCYVGTHVDWYLKRSRLVWEGSPIHSPVSTSNKRRGTGSGPSTRRRANLYTPPEDHLVHSQGWGDNDDGYDEDDDDSDNRESDPERSKRSAQFWRQKAKHLEEWNHGLKSELDNRLQAGDALVTEFEGELLGLHQTKEELLAEAKKLRKAVREVEEENTHLKTQLEVVDGEAGQWKAKALALKEKLRAATVLDERKEEERERRQLAGKVESLQRQLQVEQGEVWKLHSERLSLSSRAQQSFERAQELELALATLRKEVQDRTLAAEMEWQQQHSLKLESLRLTGQLKEKEAAFEDLRRAATQHQERSRDLETKLKMKEEETAREREDLLQASAARLASLEEALEHLQAKFLESTQLLHRQFDLTLDLDLDMAPVPGEEESHHPRQRRLRHQTQRPLPHQPASSSSAAASTPFVSQPPSSPSLSASAFHSAQLPHHQAPATTSTFSYLFDLLTSRVPGGTLLMVWFQRQIMLAFTFLRGHLVQGPRSGPSSPSTHHPNSPQYHHPSRPRDLVFVSLEDPQHSTTTRLFIPTVSLSHAIHSVRTQCRLDVEDLFALCSIDEQTGESLPLPADISYLTSMKTTPRLRIARS